MTEHICEVLKTIPVSQRKLAKEAGVSPSLLSQICSGQRSATDPVLEALAAALDRLGEECKTAGAELRKAAQEAK